MTLSLNEVQSLARKAARGAGFSWGMADEAGRAVRFLHEWGLDGAATLTFLLDNRGTVVGQCGLTLACRLSDQPPRGREEHVDVIAPALLLFGLGSSGFRMTWQDGFAYVGEGLSVVGTLPARGTMIVEPCGTNSSHTSICHRATCDDTALTKLELFARRTYAPATEQSRTLGAGGADD
ncbi:hypothetical protein POI8812_02862 [Pontivivens insulae]|uniref:DUF3726 domain-containing protein n=2 Tax=Pontivivens insulae TaxID=1639689 RepID=A0A2R8AE36_9RHOB|nr:uncharacterized protein DUF3726 [Pontivivens insulae]SPF30523.1 hypothetical protein POI8812_02862 [Pontivivens insulae]